MRASIPFVAMIALAVFAHFAQAQVDPKPPPRQESTTDFTDGTDKKEYLCCISPSMSSVKSVVVFHVWEQPGRGPDPVRSLVQLHDPRGRRLPVAVGTGKRVRIAQGKMTR